MSDFRYFKPIFHKNTCLKGCVDPVCHTKVKQPIRAGLIDNNDSLMLKVKYKGYRIWAILQTNGKYRACLVKSPATLDAKTDISRLIEGDDQGEAIAKEKEFFRWFSRAELGPDNGR